MTFCDWWNNILLTVATALWLQMMTFLSWGNPRASTVKSYVRCANFTEIGMWNLMVSMVIVVYISTIWQFCFIIFFIISSEMFYVFHLNDPKFSFRGFPPWPCQFCSTSPSWSIYFQEGSCEGWDAGYLCRPHAFGPRAKKVCSDYSFWRNLTSWIVIFTFFIDIGAFNLTQMEFKQPMDRMFSCFSCMDC